MFYSKMEGEVFAKDVTDHRAEHMSSNGTNGSKGISGVNGINGINSLHGWHEGISKPWETVHFDPLLKPKSYSIKGNYYLSIGRGILLYENLF